LPFCSSMKVASIPAPKTSSTDLSPPQGDQRLYGPPCQVPNIFIVVQLQSKKGYLSNWNSHSWSECSSKSFVITWSNQNGLLSKDAVKASSMHWSSLSTLWVWQIGSMNIDIESTHEGPIEVSRYYSPEIFSFPFLLPLKITNDWNGRLLSK
jgi:hypothetical protein